MRYLIALALVFVSSQAQGSALSAKDVRTLLSMVGFNPGTIRQLGDKGRHEVIKVKVTGRRGHFHVYIQERELKP